MAIAGSVDVPVAGVVEPACCGANSDATPMDVHPQGASAKLVGVPLAGDRARTEVRKIEQAAGI